MPAFGGQGRQPCASARAEGCVRFAQGRIQVAALEHIPGCKRGRLRYRLAAMNINAACGSRPPLVADATTFLHGKASHTILRSLALPYESCSLATPQAGAQQPALDIEQFLRLLFNEALLSHRSAGGRWCRKAPKGGEPPEAAKHRDAILADESKSIKPESASSWQLEADSFRLYRQRSLPADWYLSAFPHLRFLPRFFTSFRMTSPAGRLSCNADYKLRRQPPPQPSGQRPVKL